MNNRDIQRLHEMHKQGQSRKEIARHLGVDPAIVSWHIALRGSYSIKLVRKLGLKKPLVTSDPMSIYDAAPLLPGWPARTRLHRLVSSGVLKTQKCKRLHFSSHRQIREAAQMMLDEGLWVSSQYLPNYTPEATRVSQELSGTRLRYWPDTKTTYYRLLEASEICSKPLAVPASIKHRALIALDITGVATI